MKKMTALMLLLCMVLIPVLTGCGPKNDPGISEDGTVSFVFYTHGAASTNKEPKYQQQVLDKINEKLQNDLGFKVSIRVVSYADDVFGEKVMLDLAGKKSIDFIRFTQPTSQLADLYGKHMILDLTRYIDSAENLKANIPENVWKEVTVDGKILAIPMPVFQTTVTGWTRGDWLKKAGLDAITTFEEFETYLKYLKSVNPDITPYMAPLANIETYLLGCFTETPGSFVNSEGSIVPQYYDPGYKAFIAKLADWYAQGLIDDSIFNIDENKAIDIFGKELTGVTGSNIWQQQYGTLSAVTSAHPEWDITFLSPLSDVKKYPSGGLATEFLTIAATSSNPDKAVLFADWMMYNEENYRLVVSGIEGLTYEIGEENGNAIIKTPESEGDAALIDLYQSLFVGYNGEYNNKYASPGVPSETIRAYKECSSIPLDMVYVPVTNYYAVDIPTGTALARQDAETMVAEKIQGMIQGRIPLSDWDKMLASYESMGGLEAYQLYTDEMNRQNGK